jgi:hypothetical protein
MGHLVSSKYAGAVGPSLTSDRIKPNSVIVNKLFGGYSGFSIGAPFTGKPGNGISRPAFESSDTFVVFTLDWTSVSGYLLSPLMAPWEAILNTSKISEHDSNLFLRFRSDWHIVVDLDCGSWNSVCCIWKMDSCNQF